ncbi:hypothetical protein VNO78_27910 [Psophocarpus tetragonolobus]|uniref:Uncharacterized protein n=1 Tax=Psophocarpus tetragonolobus TaxID=3891 RepID=A0AAN9S3K9_PSOTE
MSHLFHMRRHNLLSSPYTSNVTKQLWQGQPRQNAPLLHSPDGPTPPGLHHRAELGPQCPTTSPLPLGLNETPIPPCLGLYAGLEFLITPPIPYLKNGLVNSS